MVNANRDYISTNNLGDSTDSARNMFSSITKRARMKFAEEYYSSPKFESSYFLLDISLKQVQKTRVKVELLCQTNVFFHTFLNTILQFSKNSNYNLLS